MKVLAINSSARIGGESKTEFILDFLVKGMKEGFNPEKADGFKGCYEFVFSGKHEGTCYFEIKNNEIHCNMGSASQPDITITTPFEVWMDILTKKAGGAGDENSASLPIL